MRKTKQYRKKNKTRTRRTRKNIKRRYIRRGMKGGTFAFSSLLGDAYDSIGYSLTKGVDAIMVPPTAVLPNKMGGDNPLPFHQTGPTQDISKFDYTV